MAIVDADIMFFGSQTMLETDAATGPVGGAIDKGIKMTFADLSANALMEVVSETTDTTQNVTITGRNAAGTIVSDVVLLTGTTPVADSSSPNTFERLLKVTIDAVTAGSIGVMETVPVISGTADAGNLEYLDLDSGTASATANAYQFMVLRTTGGTGPNQIREIVKYGGSADNYRAYVRTFSTLPDATTTYDIAEGFVLEESALAAGEDILECRRTFYDAAAEPSTGSSKDLYEKVYAWNNHATLSLTNSTIAEVAGGVAANVTFDLETTLDGTTDNGSTNNRVTEGTLTAFTFDSAADNVANSQSFTAQTGQGIWLKLTLAAGTAATNDTYTMQVSGQST